MNLFSIRWLGLTCVFEDIDAVSSSLTGMLNSRYDVPRYSVKTESSGVPIEFPFELIAGSRPLTASLWEPQSKPGATIIFPNRSDGLSWTIRCLSKLLASAVLRIKIRDSIDAPHGNEFCYSQNYRQIKREVAAVYAEDGWTFVSSGAPLWFEDPTHYARPKVRDRLTREILVQYLLAFDLDIRADSFWQTNRSWHLLEDNRKNCELNTEKGIVARIR